MAGTPFSSRKQPAPGFALRAPPDQTVSLSDFRRQPMILAFYGRRIGEDLTIGTWYAWWARSGSTSRAS